MSLCVKYMGRQTSVKGCIKIVNLLKLAFHSSLSVKVNYSSGCSARQILHAV